MASCCVTPDSLPDIYNRILTLNDQNQTPFKLEKRSSRVKEKDSYCLCCGTNLYDLAGKVSKLLNCETKQSSKGWQKKRRCPTKGRD